MSSQQIKILELEKRQLTQNLAHLQARLASRDELLRRIRSEQQWSAEALASMHVPLMALNGRGDLFWLNQASERLLGLNKPLDEVRTADLPQHLRQTLEERLVSDASDNQMLEATLKLHGQGYRVCMQYLETGAAAKEMAKLGSGFNTAASAAQWLVSLVPEQGDIVAQALGYPDLPEVSMGADGGGAVELNLRLGEQELALSLQPVLGMAQFLGTEQLARIAYQARPSSNLDLALVNAIAERIISDRLGALTAGTWMLRLSEESLHDRDFASRLMQLLTRHQINGSRFVFGLPEAEVMDALVLMRQLQADLATSGIRWALLETSSDLTNFEYLSTLGLDFYCINPDLVVQAAHQSRAKSVLQALHEAAAGQGMATLATGVDSPEAMTVVRAAGIDYASGRWASQESIRYS